MCRLALALGKTLPEIAAMSREEFHTWMAFYQLEPFGCTADDSRAEAQMALFWQANSDGKSKVPERFIVRYTTDEEEAKPKQSNVKNQIKGFFDAYIKKSKKEAKRKKKAEAPINTEVDTNKEAS